MAANKIFNFGPIWLTTTTTTNILNPAVTSLAGPTGFTPVQPTITLTHIKVVNNTASAATFSLWKGASGTNAAGTALAVARSVPAYQDYDLFYPKGLVLTSELFLVGGAGTATALTIHGSGEIGF